MTIIITIFYHSCHFRKTPTSCIHKISLWMCIHTSNLVWHFMLLNKLKSSYAQPIWNKPSWFIFHFQQEETPKTNCLLQVCMCNVNLHGGQITRFDLNFWPDQMNFNNPIDLYVNCIGLREKPAICHNKTKPLL